MFHNRRPLHVLILASIGLSLIIQQIVGIQPVFSQSPALPFVSYPLIGLVENQMTYYNLSVPVDAGSPRLIGHYNVPSGLDIEVAVVDMEECPQESCVFLYHAVNRTSDNIDVALTPGKTYRLAFLGQGSFAGERIVEVDFHVQYVQYD
jgi:hypothetical protein